MFGLTNLTYLMHIYNWRLLHAVWNYTGIGPLRYGATLHVTFRNQLLNHFNKYLNPVSVMKSRIPHVPHFTRSPREAVLFLKSECLLFICRLLEWEVWHGDDECYVYPQSTCSLVWLEEEYYTFCWLGAYFYRPYSYPLESGDKKLMHHAFRGDT